MPQLYVQVLNPGGRQLTVEGEGEMTVLDHKWRVYQQDPAAHPGLQRLIFGSAELADASTLAECCEMLAEAELKVMVSPAAQIVVIIVGGIKHVTTLATLLSRPGTPIFETFEGLRRDYPPCFPTGGGGGAVGPDGIMEGPALPRLAGPLPMDSDGVYHLDRNGVCFGYVLD